MENLPLSSIDDVDDISAIDNYRVAIEAGVSEKEALHMIEKYGRDNARTPFQWNGSANAGFTSGMPWLKVNPNYPRINLETERKDPASVFNYYKKLVSLRKNERFSDIFTYGRLVPYLADRPRVTAYFRELPDHPERILVAANYGPQPQTLPLPASDCEILLCNTEELPELRSGELRLTGYQCAVIRC